MKPGAPPTVSVIVPVRNGARWLPGLIESIRANAYPADRVEIVVADHRSTDGSAAIAAQAGAVVVPVTKGPVGHIRNQAVSRSRGDVLAFIDADHSVAPSWLASAAETLAAPGVGAVGSLCHPPRNGGWVQRTYDGLRSRPDGTVDVEWLGSGNMAVWRRVFDDIGGFDATLEACEDVDLCQRLRHKGYRLVSDSRLRNEHHGDPATLGAVLRGELWRGRDNLRVGLRSTASWRALPGLVMPVAGLFLFAWLALAPLFLLAGRPLLALAPACGLLTLWALRAGVMAVRRRWSSPVDWLRAAAVAAAYETGRSLALVAGWGHGVRRQEA
jgi:hypothetical protein